MAAPDDAVVPFHLARSNVRGRVVRLDGALETILDQHRYPAPVSALVAEAVVLTALIGAAVKLRWRFSLQIRGDGPVRLIATDWFAPEEEGTPARLRAYAGFDKGEVVSTRRTPFGMLGAGVFGVTIDQGRGMLPYQGMTPLTGASLAACAETYFAQSEQLATRIVSFPAGARELGEDFGGPTGGLMLQQMPSERPASDMPADEDGSMIADGVAAANSGNEVWSRVGALADRIEAHRLIGPRVDVEVALTRVFREEEPSVFPACPVEFGCTCSAERVKSAMAQYSAKDIGHMTTADGEVTADCQFCGAHYAFDPKTLGFEAEA